MHFYNYIKDISIIFKLNLIDLIFFYFFYSQNKVIIIFVKYNKTI